MSDGDAAPAAFLDAVAATLAADGVRARRARAGDVEALVLDELRGQGGAPLRVRCARAAGRFHPALIPLRVALDGLVAAPIVDEIAAIGATLAEAIEHGAALAVASFFRPLHALVHGAAPSLAFISTTPAGELLGWHVHTTGPFGSGAPAPARHALLSPLLAPLCARLVDRERHALGCFVSRPAGPLVPGALPDAACQLDGASWRDGLIELCLLAEAWGDLAEARRLRQWLFFAPATRAQMGDDWDQIVAAMQRG